MNTWNSEAPRSMFALAATALSALTLGTFVLVPARYDAGFAPPPTPAAVPRAPVEVALVPARVDVVGVREPDVAWALGDPSQPCKPAT